MVHNCSTIFIFKHDDVMIIGNSFTLEIVQGFKNIQELLVYQTLYASVAFLSCNTEFGHVVCLWLGLNCDFLESTIFLLLSRFVIWPQSPHITHYTLSSQTHYCVCHLFFSLFYPSVSLSLCPYFLFLPHT